MISETPSLSLCLPTYNRAVLLTQALDALLAQIGPEQAAQVEVLVLDNASSDGTPDVIEEAAQRFSHVLLRSVRHPANIGPDANFLEAIKLARGQFVLLVSDDDILLPGAVAKLLALIQAHPDFDGFCLNVRSFTHNPGEGAPWLGVSEDQTIFDRDEMLRLVTGYIQFLSILAFNKSRIAQQLESGQYQDKIGTHFLQSYLFLEVIAGGRGLVVTAQPMVAQRVDNAHALNYFQVFVTEYHALLQHAKRLGYSREAIRRSRADCLLGTRHFVCRVMIYGRETEMWSSRRDGIRRLFRVYGLHPYLWLVIVPLMFFPSPLRPVVFTLRRLMGRSPLEERKPALEI